jgi:hypothetical protein
VGAGVSMSRVVTHLTLSTPGTLFVQALLLHRPHLRSACDSAADMAMTSPPDQLTINSLLKEEVNSLGWEQDDSFQLRIMELNLELDEEVAMNVSAPSRLLISSAPLRMPRSSSHTHKLSLRHTHTHTHTVSLSLCLTHKLSLSLSLSHTHT